MRFELWDRLSGNRLGSFRTAQEAYRLVCKVVDADGVESATELVLGFQDDLGRTAILSEGKELIEYARRAQLTAAI
jgi:hypothetical protein